VRGAWRVSEPARTLFGRAAGCMGGKAGKRGGVTRMRRRRCLCSTAKKTKQNDARSSGSWRRWCAPSTAPKTCPSDPTVYVLVRVSLQSARAFDARTLIGMTRDAPREASSLIIGPTSRPRSDWAPMRSAAEGVQPPAPLRSSGLSLPHTTPSTSRVVWDGAVRPPYARQTSRGRCACGAWRLVAPASWPVVVVRSGWAPMRRGERGERGERGVFY
jgi:hypothetical protein